MDCAVIAADGTIEAVVMADPSVDQPREGMVLIAVPEKLRGRISAASHRYDFASKTFVSAQEVMF